MGLKDDQRTQAREVLAAARDRIAAQPDIAKGYAGPMTDSGEFIRDKGVWGKHGWDELNCTCAGIAIQEAVDSMCNWSTNKASDDRWWRDVEQGSFFAFRSANGIEKASYTGGNYMQTEMGAVAQWNDAPEREQADVVEAFEKALGHASIQPIPDADA